MTICLGGCSERNEIKAPAVGEDDSSAAALVRPDQQIRDAQIGLFDGSTKTVDIHAEYIEKFSKRDSTLAWGLDVYFFDADGRQTSRLTADSGYIRESMQYLMANGNVVVVNEDSSRLETEQLIWYGRDNKIENDVFVRLYQHGDTLEGIGIVSYKPYKGFKIKKHGRGTFQDIERVEDE
jgi:LPS export ABC transporter protein LptC